MPEGRRQKAIVILTAVRRPGGKASNHSFCPAHEFIVRGVFLTLHNHINAHSYQLSN
jgi:hypothetical protein